MKCGLLQHQEKPLKGISPKSANELVPDVYPNLATPVFSVRDRAPSRRYDLVPAVESAVPVRCG